MKPNVGPKEAIGRIALGVLVGIVAARVVRSRLLATALGALAFSGIETGITRYCPVNEVLGIDNARKLKESPMRHIHLPKKLTEPIQSFNEQMSHL